MLRAFSPRDGRLAPADDLAAAVWLDLLSPDAETLAAGAAALGAPLPTRAAMEEIEHSSRVYREGGVAYLTVMVPTRAPDGARALGPVAFVLARGRLATVRFHEPSAFDAYPARAGDDGIGCADGAAVLHGLVEAIVDRLADILESGSAEIDALAREVLAPVPPAPGAARRLDLRRTLAAVGREGELLGDVRLSLLTIERMLAFLDQEAARTDAALTLEQVRRTQARDLASLAEHAGYLEHKINLALDATLGMISIEQNASIRIFSVLAVVFLPPTLIASIYGMNFAVMPELHWTLGYPFALAVMVASAALTWWAFKRMGWL